MWPKAAMWLVPLLILVEAGRIRKQGTKHFKNYSHVRRNASSSFGLWPRAFNLATKAIISVNATCGEGGREEFCWMVDNGKERCGICDNFSTDPAKKHPIGYAIDGTNKWWQSPALFYGKEYEYVTITIDLKQVYQITYVKIKAANSPRPGTWILERSLDNENYEAWQYFARSDKECLERFGVPATKGKPHYFTDSEVICTSFYSRLENGKENGEIHTSLMHGRPGANETSPELLQFTKARYVRLRLMGLRSTDDPHSQDISKDKRLYYTIKDISIFGHCVCNGHAENCRHNVASGHPECKCVHNTCGPNCDKCCPMYNQRQWGPGSSRDARQCLPCNCHGHSTSCHYDENVDKAGLSMDIHGNYQGGGVCDNCTSYTTGINCERCMPGYYRPYGTPRIADKPCLKCDCDLPGSSGICVQEGEFAGTCVCLSGYEGKKCEMCAEGYRGWPKCESCPCDNKGILEMEDCEGECICKANVEGEFCDRCKPGFFALRSDNPEGCTSCYCFGVTTLCESAFLSPKKIQSLNEWLTTDLKISEVVKPSRDEKGLVIGNYELPNIESLYWLAPEPYLGNKLEYYGSVFTFKVHWVIMRGDTSGKPTTGPNIIIMGNNGLKMAHGNDFFTTSNTTFQIKLNENGWYLIPPEIKDIVTRLKRTQYIGDPVNRRQFLNVLANVSHILLRATFHTDQSESLLEEAMMHPEIDNEIANVEKCSCPSGYSGLSCESCAFGYVKIMTNASSKLSEQSFCGKCDCNGHSETCNPDTGECFCQHNTIGENCERCKPGFYGNPLRGTEKDCKKCACPLENDENNFSPSCQLDYLAEGNEEEGGYVCTQCPRGYTGDHCEICDDGYYGNPLVLGSICKPCNCNGGPCHRITGQCLSCKGNTEGWRCERCKPGYYGDASTFNCLSCQCDPIGAISKECDNITGQCMCKERFTGRTCEKCEKGYGNITALCTPCACNPVGSKSALCDQHTGLCPCRKGVEGFHCDTCQNLHYGLSENGCKECRCDPQGSKFPTCDITTGKCICKPNYRGPKCDQCENGFWKTNSTPCTPCNCNKDGSISTNCDPKTGMCYCKPGVQGRKCDSCQPKHYGDIKSGCKACDRCEKEGHICHPKNGKCVCPPLTKGPKCESCVPNAWGHEPQIGCKNCECSPIGSSKMQCNLITGRCSCKIGFEGEKCDKCSFGYFGNKNCRKCNCNIGGTLPDDCMHGICKCNEMGCRCKKNAVGKYCDSCKKGTFGLDRYNPSGCTECYCSGRSTTCTASVFMWDQIRTNDVKKDPSHNCKRTSCWILPNKFTGDLTQSYGGYLRISSKPLPRFIYLSGNSITLESEIKSVETKLIENNWKLKHDTKPSKMPRNCSNSLTRPCLMAVLQNVSKIHFESESSHIKFDEILLDKVSRTVGKSQALTVENCQCPPEYTSSSCQDPNLGYYRYYPKPYETDNYIDKIIGMARRCQCNNRSDICDKQTGHCFNCKDFTTGPHCEFCAEGYYKDRSGNCSPCLCPSQTQNFAKNCTISGKMPYFMCICKDGYTGTKCNKCQDGYWGNPQEENGSCQACDCNPYGSQNNLCHKVIGQCNCKVGFTGLKCSECTSPRQVIQNGRCTPCDECTQILFHTIDNMSKDLNDTLDLFKNGLGPPWGLLNATIYKYNLATKQFENIEKAKNFIDQADLPQLERKVDKMRRELPNQRRAIEKQEQSIKNLQNESKNVSDTINDLNTKIEKLIEKINNFGKSHVDTNEALDQAKKILAEIKSTIDKAPKSKHYEDSYKKCQKVLEEVSNIYKSDLNPDEIKTGLNKLKKRLSNFKTILDQTDLINKLAKNKNKQNSNRIARLNQTINEINSKHKTINKDIVALLKKIKATNLLLQDIEKIHQILAEIDIENATKILDQDNTDVYETLEKLSEHVKNLQDKVTKYKSLFNFTKEEWKKINASAVYDSIIKGIEEANKKANEARNITLETLKKLSSNALPIKTNLTNDFADLLATKTRNLEELIKDFNRTKKNLSKLKHDIGFDSEKYDKLNSVLRNMRKKIQTQSENAKKLEKVKDEAKNISDLIASVDQQVRNINNSVQYELMKNYYKYLDLISKDEIANLTKKINLTRKHLDEIAVNISFTKYDEIKDANLNKFKNREADLNSIQKQIDRLNSSIKYANQIVKAIDFGINISNCKRRYRVESGIFRSLNISFRCKTCNLFNLNNSKNETISLKLQNSKLRIEWRKQNKSITVNESGTNNIFMQRTDSGIFITIENERETIIDAEPFQIDGNSRLQIGNVKNQSSEACLWKIILNDEVIGFWNFIQSEGNCSACHRNTTNDKLDDAFFNGKGYRMLTTDITQLNSVSPRHIYFKFSFATFDENSLIFLAHNKTAECSYVALNLKNGHLQLKVKHNNSYGVTITSQKKYNTGDNVKAEILMTYRANTQTYKLDLLGQNDTASETKKLEQKDVFKIKKSKIFLGGFPDVFINQSCIDVDKTPFLGNLKMTGNIELTSHNTQSYQIQPRRDKLQFKKAWFNGKGNIILSSDAKSLFGISFTITPVNDIDSFIMNINNTIDIFIENSSLKIKRNDGEEDSFGCISANTTYIISIDENGVSVNNDKKNFTNRLSFPVNNEIYLHLGSDKNNKHSNFTGSISDIFINHNPVLFETSTIRNFVNVQIGRDEPTSRPSKNKCVKEMQNTERYLQIPDYKTDPQAFKFGDKPNSFIYIKNTFMGKKYVLEFQFRTFYPNGLLFLATFKQPNRNTTTYLILEIQSGDIRLRVKGHKMKTLNMTKKINDGIWHHVQVEQIQIPGKKKFRVVIKIDKLWKLKDRLPRHSFKGELYVGGIADEFPIHKNLKNELHPFRGCIRSLKINRNLQVVKNSNNVFYNNIGQCFQHVEEGAYFGGDAYATYKSDFKVNEFLELSFEFKTNKPNGILLSVSNTGNSPALSVELQNGAVVMTIDMGNGFISKVNNSPHSDSTLANNEWHNITALYSSSELTVNVDGIRKSWVQSDVNSLMDEIEAPLYVGGLPSNAPSGTLKIKENFRGCIRKFKIEDNIMDWTDMKELNNVQLNSCLA